MPHQFGPLVGEALVEEGEDAADFGLFEHVERVDEGIGEDEVGEAEKRAVGVHADDENPSQVAHSLHVANVRPIQLKHLQ